MQLRIWSSFGYNLCFPIPGDYIRVLLNAAVFEVNTNIFKDIDELILYALTGNFLQLGTLKLQISERILWLLFEINRHCLPFLLPHLQPGTGNLRFSEQILV